MLNWITFDFHVTIAICHAEYFIVYSLETLESVSYGTFPRKALSMILGLSVRGFPKISDYV